MAKRIIQSAESLEAADVLSVKKQLKTGIDYYDKDIYGSDCHTVWVITEYIREKAELSPRKGIICICFLRA